MTQRNQIVKGSDHFHQEATAGDGRSTPLSTTSAVIYFTGSIIFRRRSIFSAPRTL